MRSHLHVRRLAERQHGVVTRNQLRFLGLSDSAISRAALAERLVRVHRGVYAVGRSGLSDHGRCLAAVAACGEAALLSHKSAAWAWGLVRTCPDVPHVTVPRRGSRRSGIEVHHAPALAPSDRVVLDRLPATALPRTLLDLAASAPKLLGSAIEVAERREMFDMATVDRLLERTRGHAGQGPLRAALDEYREPAFTRSELERAFLRLVRDAGLPRPATNTFVAGHEVDAFWPRECLAVEIDTYEFHGGRASFEADRLRQEELLLAGISMVRVTGRRIDREPRQVGERLAALLAQGGGATLS